MWSAVSWPRADLTVAVTVVLWAGEGETWGYKESPYSRGKKHKGMEQAQTEECIISLRPCPQGSPWSALLFASTWQLAEAHRTSRAVSPHAHMHKCGLPMPLRCGIPDGHKSFPFSLLYQGKGSGNGPGFMERV